MEFLKVLYIDPGTGGMLFTVLFGLFGVVVFAGENATRATDFYNKCVGSVTPMQELAFLKLIEKEYNVISEFYIKPNISEQEDVTEMPHK